MMNWEAIGSTLAGVLVGWGLRSLAADVPVLWRSRPISRETLPEKKEVHLSSSTVPVERLVFLRDDKYFWWTGGKGKYGTGGIDLWHPEACEATGLLPEEANKIIFVNPAITVFTYQAWVKELPDLDFHNG